MKALLSPLLLLAGLAAPAHAADLATIGCVEEKLPLPARAQIVLDVERNLAESGKRQTYDPKVVNALRIAAADCVKEHGWSQAAAQPAVLYARARIGWPVAQRIASERGLDPALLETLFLGLPEEQRNAPLTVDIYRELADAAVPEGEARTAETGELVSEFFGFLSIMQYSSYEFSQA